MLISSQKEADEIFRKLSNEKVVAIDSEFHWTSTYGPIPALIQLGTDEEIFLIDPLEIDDFSSFKEFLESPDCIKVFHSCSQDLILFMGMCDAITAPIFDTQIAWAFLSSDHQISYGGLVENITGEKLSKGSQRSNWLRRPLSPTQIEYAKNDVSWLFKCHIALEKKLNELDRYEWNRSECSNLESSSFHQAPDPKNLYKKIRGTGRLNRNQLSIMRELCAWREKTAKKINTRPKRVLSDECLFSIVYKQPRNTKDLNRCQNLNPKTIKYNSREIIHCIDAALSIEDHLKPEVPERRIPSKAEDKLADKISAAVNNIAEKLGMSPSLLLTRQYSKKIAAWHFSDLPVDYNFISSWRKELIEAEINEILKNT